MEICSPPFPVFIDSNLNTHLVLLVSPLHTTADLKKNIQLEHAACFPNIGQVNVEAIRVKRRGAFYHMSDSMLVRSVFDGIKGTWFLSVDLAVVKRRDFVEEDFVEGSVRKLLKDVPALLELSSGRADGFKGETLQRIVDNPGVDDKQLDSDNNDNVLLTTREDDLLDRNERTSFDQVNNASRTNLDMALLEEKLGENSKQLGVGTVSFELGKEMTERKDDVQVNDVVNLRNEIGDKILADQVEKGNIEEVYKISEAGDGEVGAKKKRKSRKKIKVSHDIHTDDILVEDSFPQEENKAEMHEVISMKEEVNNDDGASNFNVEEASLPLDTAHASSEVAKETKQSRKRSRNKLSNKQLESDPVLPAEPASDEYPVEVPRNSYHLDNHDSVPSLDCKRDEESEKAKVVDEVSQVHDVLTEPTALEKSAKLDSEVPNDLAPVKKKPSKKSTKKSAVSAPIQSSEDRNIDDNEETLRNKDRKLLEEPYLEKKFPESVGPLDPAKVESKFSSINTERILPDRKDKEKADFTNLNPSDSCRSVNSFGYPENEGNGKTKSTDNETQGQYAITEASSHASAAKVDYGPATSFDDKNSRRQKKKSSKSKLQNSEYIHLQLPQPLVKEVNNGLQAEHEQSNLDIKLNLLNSHVQDTVAASLGNIFSNNSIDDQKASTKKKKVVKKDKNDNFGTEGNMDKISGGDNQNQGSTKLAMHDRHDKRDVHHRDDISVMPGQRNSSEGKEEQGSIPELPGKENAPNATCKGSAESPPENSPVDVANPDNSKINFLDHFLPKDTHHESLAPASELPLEETETRKHNKGKTKKKKQTNVLPSDSTPGAVNLPNSHEHLNIQSKSPVTNGDQSLLGPEFSSRAFLGGNSSDYAMKKASNAAHKHGPISSELLSPQNSHDSSAKRKLHAKKRQPLDETALSCNKENKNGFSSKSEVQSLNSQDTNGSINARVDARKPVKLTGTVKGSIANVGATQVPIPAADVQEKEPDLAASSDSTEGTPVQRRRYKIAVRKVKVPGKGFSKVLDKSKKEDNTLVPSHSIFSGATSDNSEDEVSNKEKHREALSDDSPTSVASDADTEDTTTPGYKSTANGINDDAMNEGLTLSQSSNITKRGLPLDAILRSTSRYKKAKVLASQSQADDELGQSPHEVPETQPE